MLRAPAIETVLENCVVSAIAEDGHFVSEVDAVSTHVRVNCSFSTYERAAVMSTFHALWPRTRWLCSERRAFPLKIRSSN
jgi:hypothetical protein